MKILTTFANNLGKVCLLCMGVAFWLSPPQFAAMAMFAVYAVFRAITLLISGYGLFHTPYRSNVSAYISESRHHRNWFGH